MATETGSTESQVGLSWQLTHAPNTMLIPGTADPLQLRENLSPAILSSTPQSWLDSTPSAADRRLQWCADAVSRARQEHPGLT